MEKAAQVKWQEVVGWENGEEVLYHLEIEK